MSEYFFSCKLAKLSLQEMKMIKINTCLDIVDEYVLFRNPDLAGPKMATQDDINKFKGR